MFPWHAYIYVWHALWMLDFLCLKHFCSKKNNHKTIWSSGYFELLRFLKCFLMNKKLRNIFFYISCFSTSKKSFQMNNVFKWLNFELFFRNFVRAANIWMYTCRVITLWFPFFSSPFFSSPIFSSTCFGYNTNILKYRILFSIVPLTPLYIWNV